MPQQGLKLMMLRVGSTTKQTSPTTRYSIFMIGVRSWDLTWVRPRELKTVRQGFSLSTNRDDTICVLGCVVQEIVVQIAYINELD